MHKIMDFVEKKDSNSDLDVRFLLKKNCITQEVVFFFAYYMYVCMYV